MGRMMLNSTLEPGTLLCIGGKEVEVDSVLSNEAYLSARPSLGVKDSPAMSSSVDKATMAEKNHSNISRTNSYHTGESGRTKTQLQELNEVGKKTLNVSAPKSIATKSAFKAPLKENTVCPAKPCGTPTPRHDPYAPGAVVMKRPASVPKDKQIVDVVVDPLLGKHLREHQREGVKFLYECVMGLRDFNGEGAILADEMGLGKTLQAITLLWTLLKQNPIHEARPEVKRALIICPATLVKNWRMEFRKWLGNDRIGVFVVDDKTTRLTDFTMGRSYSVMIIGYERFRNFHAELTKGPGIDIVIADEGHRLKTVQNKAAQAIQFLDMPRRVILSGTPIQNDLSEFFAAVDLVNPGLLGTYKKFMKEFERPIIKSRQREATKKDIEKGNARSEELTSQTSMFLLRRNMDILSDFLPPKTEYVLFCNPTSPQANIYRLVLGSPVFQTALGNSECALQLITILKKLCNSPSLLSPKVNDDKTANSTISALLSTLPPHTLRQFSPASSGKIRVLDQLLHNVHSSTSEKIVLVSNYTSTLNVLATLLTSLSLPFLRLDGSTPTSKRQGLVDDFNRSSASSCFAFLLSAKAGGVGLNLTGASRLVLFDADWNPATDNQAMARIHRDGQKKHCRIYRFLLKGGLEEKIWQRQVTKIGLADSVMVQKSGVAQFSREELRDLFRLDEDSQCQTHDLLQCKCGGRGESFGASDDACEPGTDSEDDEDTDDLDNFPPNLIKASELEEHAAKSDKRRSKKMLSLLQYSHFDSRAFSSADIGTPLSRDQSADSEADKNALATDDGSDAARFDLEEQIGDDVLLSLLKEEGNGVGYLFKKKGFSASNNNAAGQG